MASSEFEVASEISGDVIINSYSFSGGGINKKALQAAVRAIDIYSEVFGDYPYETFNVAEANFYIGGMEYPGMVMIDVITSYSIHYTKLYDFCVSDVIIICKEITNLLFAV